LSVGIGDGMEERKKVRCVDPEAGKGIGKHEFDEV